MTHKIELSSVVSSLPTQPVTTGWAYDNFIIFYLSTLLAWRDNKHWFALCIGLLINRKLYKQRYKSLGKQFSSGAAI